MSKAVDTRCISLRKVLGISAFVAFAAVAILIASWFTLATKMHSRGDCHIRLIQILDAIRNHVQEGESLEDSVREVEESGLLLECAGNPILVNPDESAWSEDGAERQEMLLIATKAFEGKESVIDVEGEPFCYGIDALWKLKGIPVSNLPDWAK